MTGERTSGCRMISGPASVVESNSSIGNDSLTTPVWVVVRVDGKLADEGWLFRGRYWMRLTFGNLMDEVLACSPCS